jgi:hypothetical protein
MRADTSGCAARSRRSNARRRLLGEPQHSPRVAKEELARRRRPRHAPAPVDEPRAHRRLERFDLEAHRRLADAERLGGAREAAVLEDGPEGVQLIEVHGLEPVVITRSGRACRSSRAATRRSSTESMASIDCVDGDDCGLARW